MRLHRSPRRTGSGWTCSRKRNKELRAAAAVLPEERPMIKGGHLWAIGYDDMERAEQVRAEVTSLGESRCLILLNTAVAVRYSDGSVTLDGEPYVAAPNFSGHTFASFLAG